MQRNANLVDLEKCCKMRLFSLSQLSIQPRTSPLKFGSQPASDSPWGRINSHGFGKEYMRSALMEAERFSRRAASMGHSESMAIACFERAVKDFPVKTSFAIRWLKLP